MSGAGQGVDREFLAGIRKIGEEVAGAHADEVDREARFPEETFGALRAHGLLGALVPTEDGGLGQDLRTVAATVRELGRHCASSAMILAMHHIQVACLVEHGRTPELADFVRRVAAEQLLLASSTTEIGIGGDTRRSSCHIAPDERDPGRFVLHKVAPVISYGEHADAVVVTARRDADAAPSDQVLAVCPKADVRLTPISGWDTLGFRGTCSLGFELDASGDATMVLPVPYATISAQTMLPVAHLLWASLWLGIADEASDRARRFVQKAARRDPSTTPPGAQRLAELAVTHQQFSESLQSVLDRYLSVSDDAEATSAVDFVIAVNTLKVSASTLVVDLVGKAMLICGIAGYREDSEYSLGRLLRDAHGAAVMVNNDRILGNTSQLVLAYRP